MGTLIRVLDAPRLAARYGACQSLALLKAGAAPAVPALKKMLGQVPGWKQEVRELFAALDDSCRLYTLRN